VKRYFPAAALAAALAAAWLPLASPHALAGHSAMADRIRAEAIHAAVRGGDLLPAWLPDLYDRHGTPLPIFYAPLSYGVIEVLRWVAGDPGSAVKLAFLGFWITGVAGAGYLARRAFGADAAIPAAAAFGLSPYLLADAYVRVGIAEFAALCLLPWAIAATVRPDRASVAWGSLAVAGLCLTHNLTALLAVPALLLFSALAPRGERAAGLATTLAGVALSAFFWLPALAGRHLLWADESLTRGFFDYREHFVAPWNVLPFRVSFGFTVGPHARQAFRFGELLWAGILAAPWLARAEPPDRRRRTWLAAAAALGALLMTTSLAAPVWRLLPLARFVQFPFRFFLLATAFAAPLVGLLVVRVPGRHRPWAAAAGVAIALLIARPSLDVRYLFLRADDAEPVPVARNELAAAVANPLWTTPDRVVTLDRLRGSHWSGSAGNEFLPRTVTTLPRAEPSVAAEPLDPGVRVLDSAWGYPSVTARIEVRSPGRLALEQFDFPGWRVTVDGRPRAASVEPGRGRILVAVEPGDRLVEARFGASGIRRWAGVASLLAALGLAGGLLASRRRGPFKA
jgi:hypothetical protein